jgi:hypothetical protein
LANSIIQGQGYINSLSSSSSVASGIRPCRKG